MGSALVNVSGALDGEGTVVLENRRPLAGACESGFPHRAPPLQNRPDIDREPDLAQTPGEAFSDPARAGCRSASRHRHEDDAIGEGGGEATMP